MRHFELIAPICFDHSFPLISKNQVVSFVSGRLEFCSPTTIRRAIISIRVYAVDFMVWGWSFSHVLKKGLKGVFPTLANGYSPAPIIGIGMALFVCSAGFNRPPDIIFGSLANSGLKTATRFFTAIFNQSLHCDCGIPAITLAKVEKLSMFSSNKFKWSQAIKFCTDKFVHINRLIGTLVTSNNFEKFNIKEIYL